MNELAFTTERRELVEQRVSPEESVLTEEGILFLDFGQAAFGTVVLPSSDLSNRRTVVVHLGEALNEEGRVDRSPPGTIRYLRVEQAVESDQPCCRLIIPPDERNTGSSAILMPETIGEVYPFRYAEIEDGAGLNPDSVQQVRVHYPFDDGAATFRSSDSILNAVWDLCKYSIKATTFCGVYVDGDRERIPYEGDAYINQLGHYCLDAEYALARYTHEYLIQRPTWPTEWILHSVLMAWADYLYSGETASLERFYEDLCAKTLIDLAREDGLISVESEACTPALGERLHLNKPERIFNGGLKDLVDWPPGSFTQGGQGERDDHEMLPVNTVVNALHAHALALMARMARALGRKEDEDRFADQAGRMVATINRLLFDEERGVYVDGE
ncbi:MAG: family 78 glycoside hydrolase catalytic domain, partial [Planctomycetota bacterium]